MDDKRLLSIDSLRGAAALAVVLCHSSGHAPFKGTGWAGYATELVLFQGWVGVILFFVISGFCIHLRWARGLARGERTRIDLLDFWKRRARRLYPPYLVVLALYIVAQTAAGTFTWSRFNVYDLMMHLAMLHNLDGRTAHGIDRVFWTLAIEEQLYLAYFALLWLRERFGWTKALGVCLAVRVGWFFGVYGLNHLLHGHLAYTEGGPAQWFVWALGALAVEASVGALTLPRWCSRLWLGLAALGFAMFLTWVSLNRYGGGVLWRIAWLSRDPVWGLGFFIVVNRAVLAERAWKAERRFPGWAVALAWVGVFSYSLYLTHDLVFLHAGPALYRLLRIDPSPWHLMALAPLALGLAWVFFQTVERRFLNTPPPALGQGAVPLRSSIRPAIATTDSSRV